MSDVEAEDLAAKFCAFASEVIAVKHLIEFALPPKKRANAAEVTAKGASAAAGSQSSGQGDTTEHTKANRRDHEEADDQCETMSAATEHDRKPTKQLKQHDVGRQKDSHDVVLNQQTAKAMAEGFFKFVEQEHLQQHLSRMSAGQILVLADCRDRKASLCNYTTAITIGYQSRHILQLHK